MENLISWVKGIVCYSILTAVLMELLPGKFTKYIKLYMGLLFILLFLSPLMRLFHLEDIMEELFYKENLKIEMEDMGFELQLKEEAAYEELKAEYTRQLTGELSVFLNERGYELSSVDIAWNQNTDRQDFGRVAAVSLTVIPMYSGHAGIKVDKVRVEVFQKQEENMEEKALKNELVNFYNIDEANINVSIQGGEGV